MHGRGSLTRAVGDLTSQKLGPELGRLGRVAESCASRAMGCCQDKNRQASDDQARENGKEEGREGRTRLKRVAGGGMEVGSN